MRLNWFKKKSNSDKQHSSSGYIKPVKIVYFDESSALDFVDVKTEGRYSSEIVNTSKRKRGVVANLNVSSPSAISGFLSSKAGVGFSKEGTKFVESSISSTILTDFLKNTEDSDKIRNLRGFMLSLTDNTKLILYTSITDALDGDMPVEDNAILSFSKLGGIFDSLQGYFECYAEKENNEKVVLRFNTKVFRNNYKLADVLNMDLSFYVVEVGSSYQSTLESIGLDFSNDGNIKREVKNNESSIDKGPSEKIKVYDVVLAGVI